MFNNANVGMILGGVRKIKPRKIIGAVRPFADSRWTATLMDDEWRLAVCGTKTAWRG
jgi:hypothetical protein